MALLLALTGGLLDAAVYTLHGHVFANVMTGNLVMFGVSAVAFHWSEALRYLVPLLAFLAGVASFDLLRAGPLPHIRRVATGLEMFGLLLAGALPADRWHIRFTALVAFVAAAQVASFRRVDGFAYNTTVITGNLRDLAGALIDTLRSASRRKGLIQLRDLGLVCACFLGGVLLGARLAPRLGNYTFWVAEAPLALVLLLLSRQASVSASPHLRA